MASRHQPGVRWTRGCSASRKTRGGEPSLGIKRVLRSARVWVVVTASLYTGRGLRLVPLPIYHPTHSSQFSSCSFILFFFLFFSLFSFLFSFSLCLPLSCIVPLTTRLDSTVWMHEVEQKWRHVFPRVDGGGEKFGRNLNFWETQNVGIVLVKLS